MNRFAILARAFRAFLLCFPALLASAEPVPPTTRPDLRPIIDQLLLKATEELGRIPEPSSGSTQTWGRWWAASDVAVAQLRAGHVEAARAAANAVGNDGLKNLTFLAMASQLAREGKYDQAKAFAHWSPLIERPDLAVWSLIARTQAFRGDMAGARATAGDFKSDRYEEDLWQAISIGSAEAGRLDDAREGLAHIHEPRRRIAPLCALAIAQFEAKDQAAARESCEAAKQEMQACPAQQRARLVPTIARVLARTATVAEARAFADASLRQFNRLDAYAQIVDGLAERGDIANAIALADEAHAQTLDTDDIESVAEAYGSIVNAEAKRGEFDNARATAARVVTPAGNKGPLADTLRPLWEERHASTLMNLSEMEFEAGQPAQSMKDAAAALDVLRNGNVVTTGTYGRVAALFIRAGHVDEAFDLLARCSTNPEQRCHAYTGAANGLGALSTPGGAERGAHR